MKITELDQRGNAIETLMTADNPMVAIGRGVADHIQRMPYSVPNLAVSTSNMIKIHQHEVEKSRTLWDGSWAG